MSKPRKPIAVDLFCGVGGMSLGFEQAGFSVAAAFDLEGWNIDAHHRNFPRTASVVADLSVCSGDELRRLGGIEDSDIDVVFGGPPCQGFSVGGKRDLDDERNLLIYDFARIVRQLRPRYFVLENVAGLLQSHSMPILQSFLRRVRHAGYRIVEPIRILDASEYGVPQRRKRTFILGYQKHLPALNYPNPRGCFDEGGIEFNPKVRDAIADLQLIENYESLFESDIFVGDIKACGAYSRLMRGEYRVSGDKSYSRKWNRGRLSGCLRTRHDPAIIKRFTETPTGKTEPISRYYRLDMDCLAPTIRAGTGADHGSHTAPRPIHPTHPRCITAREAARLHSFPDWFHFHGTRWHDFRQVGNSVPPLLARAVAEAVMTAGQFR